MSFFDETKACQRLGGCAIARVYISLNPAQIEALESMLDKGRQRFVHLDAAPMRTRHSVSKISAQVVRVDCEQHAGPDDLLICQSLHPEPTITSLLMRYDIVRNQLMCRIDSSPRHATPVAHNFRIRHYGEQPSGIVLP